MADSPLGGAESRLGALERLAHHLRGMQSGLEQYATGHRSSWPEAPERWKVLLGRYDAALVQAAALLDVPVPGEPRWREAQPAFSDEDRAALEHALRSAGLDL